MTHPPYHYYYQPRDSVLTFSEAMEVALRANEHRGLWQTIPTNELIDKAHTAIAELQTATEANDTKSIHHQAVTVANYMMMVVDNANKI